MSLFQFIIIIFTTVFVLFGIDLYKRKKMNLLHFIVFIFGGGLIILFTINNDLLNKFGSFFGVARGIDVFIYVGIVTLTYFYIDLLNKHTKDKQELTKFLSYYTIDSTYQKYKSKIESYQNKTDKDNYIFLIRAYNESITIGSVIDDIIKEGYHKILVINDGSTDETSKIIEDKIKQYPNNLIILGIHTINRGGGAANQTLYNFIKKYGNNLKIKWGITFDADKQMDVKDMEKFTKQIKISQKENLQLDLLLGSRFINGSKIKNQPPIRKIILKISKIVTLVFYNINVSDPHIGYRVIKFETFSKFNITADGMHYANEINEQIRKQNLKFIEIPVNIRYTNYSLSKGQKNSNSIKIGLEMIYKKLFYR